MQKKLRQSESIQRNRSARVVYEISKINFEKQIQVSNVRWAAVSVANRFSKSNFTQSTDLIIMIKTIDGLCNTCLSLKRAVQMKSVILIFTVHLIGYVSCAKYPIVLNTWAFTSATTKGCWFILSMWITFFIELISFQSLGCNTGFGAVGDRCNSWRMLRLRTWTMRWNGWIRWKSRWKFGCSTRCFADWRVHFFNS